MKVDISIRVPSQQERDVVPLDPETLVVFDVGLRGPVAYHPRSQRFFAVETALAAALTTKEPDQRVAALRQRVASFSDAATVTDDLSRDRLNRLAINVTQTCNLSCPMCYAADDGAFGTYGANQKLLAPGVALRSFSHMCEYYPKGVQTVQFHGGEPFLHVDGIETSCLQILEESARRRVEPPVFSAISNGTCFTARALDVIERFGIRTTVSIDGTREQNDASRPWRGGRSTWDGIMAGLDAMSARGLAPMMIECTIGKPHVGADLVAMVRELAPKAGNNIHVAPAFVASSSPAALSPTEDDQMMTAWDALLDDAARSLLTDEPYYLQGLLSVVMALPHRERAAHRCPAGHDTIAVDINGNVSACFMFTGQRQFQLGSALDDADASTFRSNQQALFSRGLSRPSVCSGCFADGVCSDCAAGQHITSMRTREGYTLSCRMNRSTLARATALLADAAASPDTWATLLGNLARAPEENE